MRRVTKDASSYLKTAQRHLSNAETAMRRASAADYEANPDGTPKIGELLMRVRALEDAVHETVRSMYTKESS